jgi:hypothetical protein
MVPAEFIGRARAFRMAVAAAHPVAIAAVDRISQPLRGQAKLRQTPSASGLSRAAAAWRNQVPPAGRLGLAIKLTASRLAITEIRVGPVEFRFDAWDEGEAETAIVVTRTVLEMSAGLFRFDYVPLASVSLHALARRFQRAFDNSDAAIRADLLALVDPAADVIDRGEDFAIPVTDGSWLGSVAEVEHLGEQAALMTVRTFWNDGMGVRADVAETVGVSL